MAAAPRIPTVRIRNKVFIAEINARTVCAHCGAQPVEWHNPEHVALNRQAYRISVMVANGRSVQSISDELRRCTPLCRHCHMKEDGRLQRLISSGRSREPQTLKPCSVCDRPSRPLRRSLCSRCNDRMRKTRVVLSKANRSGYRGVSYRSTTGRWVAQVVVAGNRHYLGSYETPVQAYGAVQAFTEERQGAPRD